jgi:AcrR family transcriptional regulator
MEILMTYDGRGRRLHADETKRKIYQCAEELFTKLGPGVASVEMIVKAAGVSKGSFYVHFASKDALFMALVDEKVSLVDAEYQAWLDALPDDMPAGDVLLSLIGIITDVLTQRIGVDSMKTVYKCQLMGDAVVGAVASYNRNIFGMFYRVVERGIKQGEFRTDLAPEVLARHMTLAIRGITYDWCLRYPHFDIKAEALAHFSLLRDGLRAPLKG